MDQRSPARYVSPVHEGKFKRCVAGLLVAGLGMALSLGMDNKWNAFCQRRVSPGDHEIAWESNGRKAPSARERLDRRLDERIETSRQVWKEADDAFADGEFAEGAKRLVEGELDYLRSGGPADDARAKWDHLVAPIHVDPIDRLKQWEPMINMARFQPRGYAMLIGIATLLLFTAACLPSRMATPVACIPVLVSVLYGVVNGTVTAFVLSGPWSLFPTMMTTLFGAFLGTLIAMYSVIGLGLIIPVERALRESSQDAARANEVRNREKTS